MNNQALILCLSMGIAVGFTTESMASGSYKHGAQHGKGPSFEHLDRNADGQVTLEEISAHRVERFEKADANGDGNLSREEMAARFDSKSEERRERYLNRMFSKRDANGDDLLSLEELQGDRAERMLARADTDGNGSVSEAEFDAIRKAHREKHKKHLEEGVQ